VASRPLVLLLLLLLLLQRALLCIA